MSTNKSVEDGFQDCIEDTDHNNSWVKTKVINESSEPIPVTFLATAGDIVSEFNSITALASGSQSAIVSYTFPAGKKFFLQLAEYSGENIAEYEIFRDTTLIAKRRTYFSGGLDGMVQFVQSSALGLEISAGEVISVKVEHARPMSGDFDARILGVLEDV